ncbi:carbamoyltransferase HypF [Fimbriiglobus ruber]|uniref:Carbamoyltransferase n=1 Tax=Fimbriiglobus ruber TaxID=1908690 RepID=A0A225E9R3_9BACT|nr:carbamoyltransferase HypF [Fimbriiglobus ruber]OWK45315.1 [NiFe] hydrogenase metallocenter assembly protein HypF [Fimbriiglobus ruber]
MKRRAIIVRGLVQGVGFRPFVYGLARRLGLNGYVRNQTGGVWIEVEGEAEIIGRFLDGLTAEAPPAARIEDVSWESRTPVGDGDFRIEASAADGGPVAIGPDLATCDACLAELFDPSDRRFHYPFLNCTQCGPRLTIIISAPYDRERTTMAGFTMCPACRAEYDDPTDRRFHAQPVACPACGPRLSLVDGDGSPRSVADPLGEAVAAVRAGQILAVKGLGGYHLACDAGNEGAVAELRRRKHRDEKPFAVMVADIEAAKRLAEVSDAEATLLRDPRRPIVLLRRRPSAGLAAGVAPGNPAVGLMLPYTPLHHLLLRDAGGPLVMTSGNRSDEPIAFDDADAITRLRGIADQFLTHDRRINIRADDSVTRWSAGAEAPVRLSRGYAPGTVSLACECPEPTLAVGGQLKSVFALGRGRQATLGHHLGDLDHAEAFRAFTAAVAYYEQLFGFKPAVLVHDLHPDYASTRYALERDDVPRRIAVQHHHAHLASCLAENGLDEPAIGVTFDGSGYGLDGTIWGGEFLVGDCGSVRRAAHLRAVPMPGGEQAVREPWRMALAYLVDAGVEPAILSPAVPTVSLRTARQLLTKRALAPLTSSAGRLFDAVAAIAGVRHRVSYEGQAAIELEGLAATAAPDESYPFEVTAGAEAWEIDCRPLVAAVERDAARGEFAARIARRFHTTLVEIIARTCDRLRVESGLSLVALSGGVFHNGLLLGETVARLQADGFRVCRHRRVPAGDGGLCLGQLAVAAAVATRTEQKLCA